MTTITKERLLTIKQWRETYGPGSNVVLPAEEAEELARIALASLEADPVAYIFKHPAGKLFWASAWFCRCSHHSKRHDDTNSQAKGGRAWLTCNLPLKVNTSMP
ncbi:TPA: hypothetical protein JLI84_000101 [Escherichia coli]|nr:hypothetical protein [Escherichia coli]HAW7674003.1 hypothetical protein [Escherichia coli]